MGWEGLREVIWRYFRKNTRIEVLDNGILVSTVIVIRILFLFVVYISWMLKNIIYLIILIVFRFLKVSGRVCSGRRVVLVGFWSFAVVWFFLGGVFRARV